MSWIEIIEISTNPPSWFLIDAVFVWKFNIFRDLFCILTTILPTFYLMFGVSWLIFFLEFVLQIFAHDQFIYFFVNFPKQDWGRNMRVLLNYLQNVIFLIFYSEIPEIFHLSLLFLECLYCKNRLSKNSLFIIISVFMFRQCFVFVLVESFSFYILEWREDYLFFMIYLFLYLSIYI